jgi:flagellar biosynthesis activator protein FlaF
MYRASYAQVVEDAGDEGRALERRGLEQSIALLRAAQKHGRGSREAIDAIHFLRQLWSILLEDLASPQNGLPRELRAGLVSIGIWMLREADRIRLEESENFQGLIDVSAMIHEGLK